jgi:hypothetical protein
MAGLKAAAEAALVPYRSRNKPYGTAVLDYIELFKKRKPLGIKSERPVDLYENHAETTAKLGCLAGSLAEPKGSGDYRDRWLRAGVGCSEAICAGSGTWLKRRSVMDRR